MEFSFIVMFSLSDGDKSNIAARTRSIFSYCVLSQYENIDRVLGQYSIHIQPLPYCLNQLIGNYCLNEQIHLLARVDGGHWKINIDHILLTK